ncbi:MAG: MarR family transcriptional regulator [Candidatus Eisenbacteria bacterium]|nr:MarR family transcriptional regulator [Candidatus Eisenbacteria bacterium]
MGDTLRNRIQQSRFESPVQEAILNILVAAGHVRERVNRLCVVHDISNTQFNVLRILRGGPAEGYSRHEIQERLVERAPDVTRLIDRLESRGLVVRTRSDTDRRLSVTHITPAGLTLLLELQPHISGLMAQLATRLNDEDCHELSRICELIYSEE